MVSNARPGNQASCNRSSTKMISRNELLPGVDVLIAVRNEQHFISQCLTSILNGHYPLEKLKIYVIDGCSTDNTVEIVEKFAQRYRNVFLLHNKNVTVPYALNLAIRESGQEIIFWATGHGEYDPDYLVRCVSELESTGAASTGGLVIPQGRGFWGRVIAAALKSPLGMGFASYRSGAGSVWVDTVMGGCWRRADVEKIGGFNEQWTRNQDSEFNIRLKQNIGGLLMVPSVKCRIYVRESLPALIRQYFQYGYWRSKTVVRHPRSIKIRQILPVLFVIGLIFSIIIDVKLFYLLVFVYFIANIVAVFATEEDIDWRSRLSMLCVFPSMHLSWGLGFIRGLTSQIFKR